MYNGGFAPDSYEEMMMAAYAGNGCLTCGASTHTDRNCSWEAAMDKERQLEIERYEASEARHGGNVFRDHFIRHGTGLSDDNVRYWAGGMAEGLYLPRGGDFRHRTTLPEAAFDWPIYRAALRLEHLGHTGLEYDEE